MTSMRRNLLAVAVAATALVAGCGSEPGVPHSSAPAPAPVLPNPGCTAVPPTKVVKDADGATFYTYVWQGNEVLQVDPPPGFQPGTGTDEQLKRYYPPRGTSVEQRREYAARYAKAPRRSIGFTVCPQVSAHKPARTAAPTPSSSGSPNSTGPTPD